MLSIIIINYNTFELTKKCIDSIKKSDLSNLLTEIIVVDNNSYDTEKIGFSKYNIKYFQLIKNIGYSKAMNYGIEKSSGDYILAVNPDVLVNMDSIKNIISYYFKSTNIGVIGSKVMNENSTFQLSSRRRFPYFKYIIPYYLKLHYFGVKNLYNYSDMPNDVTYNVDSVSGAFMLFSKNLFYDVGKFDERFFLYFEDTDFCLRVKEIGYSVVYYPKSIITHSKHGSVNLKNYLFVRFHFYKSFIKFYFKYFNQYFKLI